MAAKRRKPGDWKNLAASRAQVYRIAAKGRGHSGIPSMNETGSAAYRRLMAKNKNHY
jgi:hypothetical protein